MQVEQINERTSHFETNTRKQNEIKCNLINVVSSSQNQMVHF